MDYQNDMNRGNSLWSSISLTYILRSDGRNAVTWELIVRLRFVGPTWKQERKRISAHMHGCKSVKVRLHSFTSSSCSSNHLIHCILEPHFFLDDEAAAMIPPATSPTSPKAPVTMAMPIIPSAFKHQSVMLILPKEPSGTDHKWYVK